MLQYAYNEDDSWTYPLAVLCYSGSKFSSNFVEFSLWQQCNKINWNCAKLRRWVRMYSNRDTTSSLSTTSFRGRRRQPHFRLFFSFWSVRSENLLSVVLLGLTAGYGFIYQPEIVYIKPNIRKFERQWENSKLVPHWPISSPPARISQYRVPQ